MRCPQCSDSLPPRATSCDCGWTKHDAPKAQRPDMRGLESDLANIVSQHGQCHGLPADPREAARSWIGRVEAERPDERQAVVRIGDRDAWRWPYLERVKYLLARYMRLSPHDRDVVDGGQADGVAWRGEPVAQYIDVINQHEAMRASGVDAYRAQVAGRMRAVLGGLHIEPPADGGV